MGNLGGKVSVFLALLAGILPTLAVGQANSEVARDLERAESLRAVKNLQRTYAQYSQHGLWNEMADLFAANGTFIFDGQERRGRQAIADYLRTTEGHGRQGLAAGEVHAEIIDHPVVNLSADGLSARGRWYGLLLASDAAGNASMRGGVLENEYVRERGAWKIAVHRYHPQYAGPYETGWFNWRGEDVGILPYHFTPDQAGLPIPAPQGVAPASRASLADLEERAAVLNDEQLVRNLQAAYGYYVNRRMWDDVTDLFAHDAVYEIGGVGTFEGVGIRKALERMGPAGLSHGVLNDRLQFDTVVSLAPGRREAHVRGLELGMLGEADKGEAYWEVVVFDNRFVKEDGLWKVREMRAFPLLRADYARGWGKSRLLDAARTTIVPAFVTRHPVTGKAIAAPAGMTLVATQPLTGRITPRPTRTVEAGAPERLAEVARRVRVAVAYDAAEHVSSSYGYFADDSQWDWLSALFGRTGTKQIPFAGYYTGFERISHGLHLEYGEPIALDAKKSSIAFHWRIQPVINVAPDGRSARLRTYLFHPNTSKSRGGTLFGAIYPDDHLILEDGIWRLWNLSLDEPYFEMPDWQGGWSAAREREARPAPPPRRASTGPKRYFGAELVAEFPPDVPITELGRLQEHFRGGTGEPWEWPKILPMWWGYKNPVSGRVPELFLPDCVPCDHTPTMSMTRHGYLLPTTDPVRSGEGP